MGSGRNLSPARAVALTAGVMLVGLLIWTAGALADKADKADKPASRPTLSTPPVLRRGAGDAAKLRPAGPAKTVTGTGSARTGASTSKVAREARKAGKSDGISWTNLFSYEKIRKNISAGRGLYASLAGMSVVFCSLFFVSLLIVILNRVFAVVEREKDDSRGLFGNSVAVVRGFLTPGSPNGGPAQEVGSAAEEKPAAEKDHREEEQEQELSELEEEAAAAVTVALALSRMAEGHGVAAGQGSSSWRIAGRLKQHARHNDVRVGW